MRLIRNNTVILRVQDDYIIIMTKGNGASAWDPTGTYWGLAQGFKVVSDVFSKTLVLVPLGEPSRVKYSDFRPEDLADAMEPLKLLTMPSIPGAQGRLHDSSQS